MPPYYTPQVVSAETTLELPVPAEFETPLTPVPQEPRFDTPLIPVEEEPEQTPVQLLPQLDMTGRVQGDTVVLSPADLAAGMAAKDMPPLGAPAPAAPAAPIAAPIPTLGGSFSDTGSVVSAAWESGRSVSMLRCWTLWRQSLQQLPLPTAHPAAQPMTHPAAETTQSSFLTVPQQGQAARVQVSTAVGNSAGAPVHTPPCAAKADPNAMRLPPLWSSRLSPTAIRR